MNEYNNQNQNDLETEGGIGYSNDKLNAFVEDMNKLSADLPQDVQLRFNDLFGDFTARIRRASINNEQNFEENFQNLKIMHNAIEQLQKDYNSLKDEDKKPLYDAGISDRIDREASDIKSVFGPAEERRWFYRLTNFNDQHTLLVDKDFLSKSAGNVSAFSAAIKSYVNNWLPFRDLPSGSIDALQTLAKFLDTYKRALDNISLGTESEAEATKQFNTFEAATAVGKKMIGNFNKALKLPELPGAFREQMLKYAKGTKDSEGHDQGGLVSDLNNLILDGNHLIELLGSSKKTTQTINTEYPDADLVKLENTPDNPIKEAFKQLDKLSYSKNTDGLAAGKSLFDRVTEIRNKIAEYNTALKNNPHYKIHYLDEGHQDLEIYTLYYDQEQPDPEPMKADKLQDGKKFRSAVEKRMHDLIVTNQMIHQFSYAIIKTAKEFSVLPDTEENKKNREIGQNLNELGLELSRIQNVIAGDLTLLDGMNLKHNQNQQNQEDLDEAKKIDSYTAMQASYDEVFNRNAQKEAAWRKAKEDEENRKAEELRRKEEEARRQEEARKEQERLEREKREKEERERQKREELERQKREELARLEQEDRDRKERERQKKENLARLKKEKKEKEERERREKEKREKEERERLEKEKREKEERERLEQEKIEKERKADSYRNMLDSPNGLFFQINPLVYDRKLKHVAPAVPAEPTVPAVPAEPSELFNKEIQNLRQVFFDFGAENNEIADKGIQDLLSEARKIEAPGRIELPASNKSYDVIKGRLEQHAGKLYGMMKLKDVIEKIHDVVDRIDKKELVLNDYDNESLDIDVSDRASYETPRGALIAIGQKLTEFYHKAAEDGRKLHKLTSDIEEPGIGKPEWFNDDKAIDNAPEVKKPSIDEMRARILKCSRQLEKSSTVVNSDEYKRLIDITKKVGSGTAKQFEDATPEVQFAKELHAIHQATEAYLKHKAKDGVKKNVYLKLNAVETTDKVLESCINFLGDVKIGENTSLGKLPVSLKSRENRLIEQGRYDPLNVSAMNSVVASLYAKDFVTENPKLKGSEKKIGKCILNVDRCMCKIIHKANEASDMKAWRSLWKMKNDFQRNPFPPLDMEEPELAVPKNNNGPSMVR